MTVTLSPQPDPPSQPPRDSERKGGKQDDEIEPFETHQASSFSMTSSEIS